MFYLGYEEETEECIKLAVSGKNYLTNMQTSQTAISANIRIHCLSPSPLSFMIGRNIELLLLCNLTIGPCSGNSLHLLNFNMVAVKDLFQRPHPTVMKPPIGQKDSYLSNCITNPPLAKLLYLIIKISLK